MFANWGRIVYRYRWATLGLSILLLAASIGALAAGGTLGAGAPSTNPTEAGRGAALIQAELPRATGSSFSLIFGSTRLPAADPRFRAAMLAALAPLHGNRHVQAIRTPFDVPPAEAAAFWSRDGRHALALVLVKDDTDVARTYYPALRALVHSPTLQILATGGLAIDHEANAALNHDLQRAEQLSFPLALLLLVLVFGALVAALLPLGVGILTLIAGLGGTLLLARVMTVPSYTLNVVTLIGLGVAFDYALFIVSRFREELARGASVEDSLSRALATAGRAITCSGLTVAIGLCGLLFFPGTFLPSAGVAGAITVGCAVVYALTILPALLAILGPRVNAARLPLPRGRGGLWHALASAVMRRPLPVLALALAIVLTAGAPALHLRLAQSDVSALPPSFESARGDALLTRGFPGQDQSQVSVVVRFPAGHPLSAAHVGALYDLSRRMGRLPHVLRVESVVDLAPGLSRAGYQALYRRPASALPAPVRAAVRESVGAHIVVLSVLTAQLASSDAARGIVRAIRGTMAHAVPGAQILVTNDTAADIDAIDLILSHAPAALAFIVLATYLVLFLLLGSVVLPLKAVLTDVLSIAASFGALVWIFQQGHLAAQLNITPASIDPVVPVLLFCIVFGLSMDYEVLLLSRIKEEYGCTGDTRQAVAAGIERCGRLITGAAAIMVAVFLAFAVGETALIKAFGLGMAIAVTVDATLVRAILVPALMCLLGRLNWWAPRSLLGWRRAGRLSEVPDADAA